MAIRELDDDILGDLGVLSASGAVLMEHIPYSVGVHEHRNQRRRQVDQAILERLLQGDLGLDGVPGGLLGRHDDYREWRITATASA